eukprot:TRINITY_DN15830_c0_g2_i1.p1 TRINITY_DN15830_c0_g2~~TRINITY_DN15830_c0_g2_i1.p1  ORF type:complete len:445 (+),score=66.86 TRINITY_DN15830_c0_g2_i1:1045-2379(+)
MCGGFRPEAFVDGDPSAPAKEQIEAAASFLGAMPAKVSGAIASMARTAVDSSQAAGAAGDADLTTTSQQAATSPSLRLQLSCANSQSLHLLSTDDLEHFNQHGFVVIDNFLRDRGYASVSRESAAQAPLIVRRGLLQVPLRPAKLGRGEKQWSSSAVRGDELNWLSAPSSADPGMAERATRRLLKGLDEEAVSPEPRQRRGQSAFDVCINKATGQKLGISFSSSTGQAYCTIEAVNTGLVSAWNEENPSAAIQAGDLIVEANGVTGGEAIREQVRLPGVLRLKLRGKPQDSDATAACPDGPHYEDLDVLLVKLAQLRAELDEACAFQSKQMQIMAARYPGQGARYARHVDALPEHVAAGTARRLTALYYLNPAWKAADGGQLRLHLPAETASALPGVQMASGVSEVAYDVEPVLDRLVIFGSAWLEHEVLPAQADRYTITAWIY